MRIKVLYFGAFRDITNKREEIIEFNGKMLKELISILKEKYNLNDENMIVSINYKYVDGDAELKDNDEIAIMTPVSGG